MTFREIFIRYLPEHIAAKAIKNSVHTLDKRCYIDDTIADVLRAAFVWDKTPEGFDYWNKMSSHYADTRI